MNNLFDDFCRMLAEPMPRKRAMKLIAGGLLGAALAAFAFGQKPQPAPPSGGGGKKGCPTGQCACASAAGGCCASGETCYGSGKICCGPGYVAGTCGKGKTATVACLELKASGTWANTCTVLT